MIKTDRNACRQAPDSAAMTVRMTAQYLALSECTVWRLLRKGGLRRVRVGGRVLVLRADAEAFLRRSAEVA